MKNLTLLTLLMALAPLSWGEIKFECTGSYEVTSSLTDRTWERTETVYLQNERQPFTLRFMGQTAEVNYSGEEDEYYYGKIGQDFSIPRTIMWIHRMTLEFGYQDYQNGFRTTFYANCKEAKAFKPKI